MKSENTQFASGKIQRKYLSPNRSDLGGDRGFGRIGSGPGDNQSVKTTKTAVLKEINRNMGGRGSMVSKERFGKTRDSHFNGRLALSRLYGGGPDLCELFLRETSEQYL